MPEKSNNLKSTEAVVNAIWKEACHPCAKCPKSGDCKNCLAYKKAMSFNDICIHRDKKEIVDLPKEVSPAQEYFFDRFFLSLGQTREFQKLQSIGLVLSRRNFEKIILQQEITPQELREITKIIRPEQRRMLDKIYKLGERFQEKFESDLIKAMSANAIAILEMVEIQKETRMAS